jgi:hypothetical protein
MPGAGCVSRRDSCAGGPTDWRTTAVWISSNEPDPRQTSAQLAWRAYLWGVAIASFEQRSGEQRSGGTPPTVESIIQTRSKPGPKPSFPPGVRICTECGRTKDVAEFTPIALSKSGYYGRCRACRARLAWERNHPSRRYEGRPRRQADRQPQQFEARPIRSERTCTECGLVKVVAEFTPITGRTAGWYGRCRVCRGKRARERYWADPDERERQKARVQRNRQQRRARNTGPSAFV